MMNNNWLKVADICPRNFEVVLVYVICNNKNLGIDRVALARCFHTVKGLDFQYSDKLSSDKIDHWMSLPEPPQRGYWNEINV